VIGARIFFVGGLISYRALFGFLNPWIFVPSLLVAPIFQILLFVYIGRSAGLESDEFYVIGNAVQYTAIPCLFAMTQTISGERYQQTLGYILVTPAARLPLFLGRAIPVIVNSFFVGVFALFVGGAIVGIDLPASSYAPLALVMAIAAYSCTGLGLLAAALGLIIRETSVLSNILFGLLLIFTGANVAR
jgi:ABC-2 type transport system permease protein